MPEPRDIAIAAAGLQKTYAAGGQPYAAVRDASFTLHAGECCLLLGPSGSGKTTLLSMLGCLLSPSAGELRVGGENVVRLGREKLAQLRLRTIGFVFQHAHLLPYLTVRANVELAARLNGSRRRRIRQKADELIEAVGLGELAKRYPRELSGGQRHRIAVARALMNDPQVILADEPTAALDTATGERITALLVEQARTRNACLLVVTHDTRLKPHFDRVLNIVDGKLTEEPR